MSNAPGTAHLYHLDGEIDPHLDRHSRALRRHAPWIVGAAVVGALLLGLFSLGREYGGSTSLELPSSAAELAAVDIEIESLTGDITGTSVKAAMGADALEADIESQVGGKIDVTVTDASTPTAVLTTISVTSDDEERTARAVELYGEGYRAFVQSSIGDNADQLVAVITSKEKSATDQIAALDEQLAQPGLSDALADSLSSQRIDLEAELRDLAAERDALTQFTSRPIGVVAPSNVTGAGGGVVPFIAGALLGAILATIVVLTRSFFNTRVTGRDAVDTSIAGQIIAVTALDTPDHLDTLARSIANQTDDRGVVFAPCDSGAATDAARTLSSALQERGFAAPTVIQPPQLGLVDAGDGTSAYILVAAINKTRTKDLALAASTLRDAGSEAVGTVLTAPSLGVFRDAAA